MRDVVEDAINFVTSIEVPMTLADPDCKDCPLIHANSAFEDLTGFSKTWAIGKNCRFLQGAETNRTEVEKVRSSVENRLACVSVLTNYTRSGVVFHNLLTISPILLKGGKYLLVGCQFKFDLGVEMDTVRQVSFERQQMITRVSGSNSPIAEIQKNALKMCAEAAVQRVKNYLRTLS